MGGGGREKRVQTSPSPPSVSWVSEASASHPRGEDGEGGGFFGRDTRTPPVSGIATTYLIPEDSTKKNYTRTWSFLDKKNSVGQM